MKDERWPSLPLSEWADTYATLHRWTQIVGKTRLAFTPLVNHWWNAPLYISARGLTTSLIHEADFAFEVEFDFLKHVLEIRTSKSQIVQLPLRPQSVAEFYAEYMAVLKALGIDAAIYPVPVEIEDATPFAEDHTHASYDPDYANRVWRILVESSRVFEQFRARFVGKSSPTHFFWGSFDLALTRFSGRRAPEWSGAAPHVAAWVMKEGYSHELISAGFWPGAKGIIEEPVFYSYAYPEPAGFAEATVDPASARYDATMKEFFLPYEAVRTAPSPDAMLLDFLQTTYEAGATLGNWDRAALERIPAETPSSATPVSEIEIVDIPEKRRFEAVVDGRTAFVDYRRRGDTIFLTHTEVPPALEGRGIGSALARYSLDYARANSLKVVPICPFIASYMRENPEYSDLVRD